MFLMWLFIIVICIYNVIINKVVISQNSYTVNKNVIAVVHGAPKYEVLFLILKWLVWSLWFYYIYTDVKKQL